MTVIYFLVILEKYFIYNDYFIEGTIATNNTNNFIIDSLSVLF